MTITIGLWIIPALLTVATLVWIFWPQDHLGSGYFGSLDIVGAFKALLGTIALLLAWIAYLVFAVFSKS
jgi:hypothetical protein